MSEEKKAPEQDTPATEENRDATDRDSAWVDLFLHKLDTAKNGLLEVEIDGKSVAAVIADELKEFFQDNKDLLKRLGKEQFKAFLLFLYQKREEEAFLVLLQSMSVEQLIATMKGEAEALKQYNDDMEQFIKKLKKFATQILLPITAKVLLAVLLA